MKGASSAELAAAIGTDAATLEKTIAEYQAAIEKGEDKFNRSHLPESFDGPYYAVRVTGEIRHTQGGMATDLAGHVLRADKSLIKGLYAAGGCTEDSPHAEVQLHERQRPHSGTRLRQDSRSRRRN